MMNTLKNSPGTVREPSRDREFLKMDMSDKNSPGPVKLCAERSRSCNARIGKRPALRDYRGQSGTRVLDPHTDCRT